VGTASIPAGTYAVGVHRGPYDRLHETYLDVIGRWFPASGCEPAADAVVEHYLNDPACVPASELLTEVRVRIAE
jgi:AraC family transcriptional regulator